jgi:AcrR family transcriptional regulator
MDVRERVLAAAWSLTLERGRVPSLDAVASAAGVSKGGLVHHFSTRAAIVEGLAMEAIGTTDLAMSAAAERGDAARMWLQLSAPAPDEVEVYRAMVVAFRALGEGGSAVISRAVEATARWEALIAAEVGDADRARLIRLVGDGLLMNAVTGIGVEFSPEAIESLLRR